MSNFTNPQSSACPKSREDEDALPIDDMLCLKDFPGREMERNQPNIKSGMFSSMS